MTEKNRNPDPNDLGEGAEFLDPLDAKEWDDLFGMPSPIEMDLEKLKALAVASTRPRPADYPCLYGRLNLQGNRHELSWKLERVFRPSDLLFWGQSHDTVIESFRIGDKETSEQLAGELPVAHALVNPYPLRQVLDRLSKTPDADDLAGIRLKQKLWKANHGMNFDTGLEGTPMSLVVRGPLAHALVLGASVEAL